MSYNLSFFGQVIDFLDCDSGLPVTGVLQPLTSVCGVINVIASEFLVAFEKLLLWLGNSSNLDRTKLITVEACPELISNYRSQDDPKSTESLSYPAVFLGLTGSQGEMTVNVIITCYSLLCSHTIVWFWNSQLRLLCIKRV